MRYVLSLRARRDIDEIWDFIARDNANAATRFTVQLGEKLGLLARTPLMGRSAESLGQGFRRLAVGNYLVLYRTAENHIDILQVLHGARDIEALLNREGDG
jgi:toxin ParE1/3/4